MNKLRFSKTILFLCLVCSILVEAKDADLDEELVSFKVNVECDRFALVDSLFQVRYNLQYESDHPRNIEFVLPEKFDRFVELVSLKKESGNMEDAGESEKFSEAWIAGFKALQKGHFRCPDFKAIICIDGIYPTCDTLEYTSREKWTQINTDLKDREEENRKRLAERKIAAEKILNDKNGTFILSQLEDGPFHVGDSIHCKYYILNKKTSPISQIDILTWNKIVKVNGAKVELHPFLSGLWKEIEWKGEQYFRTLLFDMLIIPEKPGEINIPKMKVIIERRVYKEEEDRQKGESVLLANKESEIITDPVKIKVQ